MSITTLLYDAQKLQLSRGHQLNINGSMGLPLQVTGLRCLGLAVPTYKSLLVLLFTCENTDLHVGCWDSELARERVS
jgi:hypothetical protein